LPGCKFRRINPSAAGHSQIIWNANEVAKAGERNVEVLYEGALNVPGGAVSASNLPPLSAVSYPAISLATQLLADRRD
jgi:hypothetical protein